MTADLLALLDEDPAAGILAAADLREQRVEAATPGPWYTPEGGHDDTEDGCSVHGGGTPRSMGERQIAWLGKFPNRRCDADASYIAAEANPAPVRAAVVRWRGVVGRHGSLRSDWPTPVCLWCSEGVDSTGLVDMPIWWPCPDFREVAGEARAYLSGAA